MKCIFKSIFGVSFMTLISFLPITAHATHHASRSSSSSSSSDSEPKLGSWQPLNNTPNFISVCDSTEYPGGAFNPILLTDGSVLVQNNPNNAAAPPPCPTSEMWKLTPDINGSYVNGTWTQVASLPYTPTFYASAVLADGRVIVLGGEYTGEEEDFTLTNQGAIYDPVSNVWTSIQGPSFFENFYPTYGGNNQPNPIGDAASVVLEDGTFMVADKLSKQAALWNPKESYLPVWSETGTATKQYMNSEEGWTLLPNGEVLTINTYKEYAINHTTGFNDFPYPFDLTQSEIYNPKTGEWSYGGSTIFPLSDTAVYPFDNGIPHQFEMGPAVLRPDGTVFCLGSNGNSAIYNTKTKKWQQGPRLPSYPAPEYQLGIQDGPGALLPNGNVLFTASALESGNPPLHVFEFDGTRLIEQPTIPNASIDVTFVMGFLVLPTGQILSVDSTNDIEIYTPGDRSYNPEWAPVIKKAPKEVRPGNSYKIEGIRFNGMSQGASYGNDFQMATNYPLVRIKNNKSGHVFYCRTHDHSFMGVASNKDVHTYFDVPANIEIGKSTLEVVANGIPSKSITIHVKG